MAFKFFVLINVLLAVPNSAAPTSVDSSLWSNVNTNAVHPPTRGPPALPSTTGSSPFAARSGSPKRYAPSPAAVEVINNCTFDVGSNLVHAPRPGVEGPPEEYFTWLPAAVTEGDGNRLIHRFEHDPNIGVSWKLAPRDVQGPVQFEWTWVPEQRKVYWDLSMIDAKTNARQPLIYPSPRSGDDTPHPHTRPAWNTSHPIPRPPRPHPHSPYDISSPYPPRNTTFRLSRPHSPPSWNTTTANSTLTHPRMPIPVSSLSGVRHPFHPYGITVTPTHKGQGLQRHQELHGGAFAKGRCGPITCPENEGTCHAGYNVWNDWQAQKDCPDSMELKVVLCGTRDS